jgi:hypothetical protein
MTTERIMNDVGCQFSLVIPANAGTQKHSNKARGSARTLPRASSLRCWVPAFAGMTMVLSSTPANAQRAPAPNPPPVRQQPAQDPATNADRAERLRRNVEGSDTPAPSSRKARQLIPAAFRGEWNADLAACGTARDTSRLIVGPDTLAFYETLGTVRKVSADGPAAIVATTDMASEASQWTDAVRMTLSGDKLLIANAPERLRCPTKAR